MLKALEGRWVTSSEGGTDGLVLINKEGGLTFVGEGGESDTRLAEAEPGSVHPLVLLAEDGEQLCTVSLERKVASEVLRLESPDGYAETWHRTCAQDGQPKVIARRPSMIEGGPARIARKWTKEGQAVQGQAVLSKQEARRSLSGLQAPLPIPSGFQEIETPKAEKLKLKFMELDECGDGMLDVDELGEILQQGRPDITDQEVAALFDAVDKDRKGRISFDAFVEFLFS
mmetsp:Transcript_138431/g.386134  ORF Transcript_138431/g.386134 Transcript_138431/m.386134 type:complete len:229 (-) Transcript_138431:231-917(-)